MLTVFTVGHSTHPLEHFIELLRAQDIRRVADVRRFPGSRRHPQFSRESLQAALTEQGIAYTWMEALGGRRTARPDSPNDGWRNAAFRGYADYMDTPEFKQAFDELTELAGREPVAIMCSESLWWRCHRRLLSDLFAARGWDVLHIEPRGGAGPHRLMPPARVEQGLLSYEKPGRDAEEA